MLGEEAMADTEPWGYHSGSLRALPIMHERRSHQRRQAADRREYDDMPTIDQAQEKTETWTIDRKLLVGLFTFIVPAAISCLMAFTDVRARVSVIEATHAERIQTQKERDDHQDAEVKEKFGLIQNQLDALNQKMDKMIDRTVNRP